MLALRMAATRRSLAVLLAAALAASCARTAPPAVLPPAAGTLVHDTVRSSALRGNPTGDPADRHVAVYLPPSYGSDPARRYPVVYLLHGFAGDPSQWTGERMRVPQAMDSLVAAGAVREMIVVMPDGKNAFGGSFYADSPATGRWEDFVARELVRHVDRRYRTVPRPAGRGIAGWSMGGHGALRLAARHPDVFGAAYALSPCCLGDLWVDFGPAGGTAGEEAEPWRKAMGLRTPEELEGAEFGVQLRMALAALLSPAPDRPFGVALPFTWAVDGTYPQEPAHGAWSATSPDSLVARHRDGLARLRGIGFDVGRSDGLRHIPPSTRALSEALARAGIPHRFEEYEGTHGSRVPERIRTRLLPFLSERLDGTMPRP